VLTVDWKSWGLPLTTYPFPLSPPSVYHPTPSWAGGWAKSWGKKPPSGNFLPPSGRIICGTGRQSHNKPTTTNNLYLLPGKANRIISHWVRNCSINWKLTVLSADLLLKFRLFRNLKKEAQRKFHHTARFTYLQRPCSESFGADGDHSISWWSRRTVRNIWRSRRWRRRWRTGSTGTVHKTRKLHNSLLPTEDVSQQFIMRLLRVPRILYSRDWITNKVTNFRQ